MNDIECPRCHRISFSWETHKSCTACHWPIRPVEVAEPYGYDVLVEVRTGTFTTTTVERHYKGNETTARRRAKSVRDFVRVLAAVPLSREQWIGAYGDDTMKDRWA